MEKKKNNGKEKRLELKNVSRLVENVRACEMVGGFWCVVGK